MSSLILQIPLSTLSVQLKLVSNLFLPTKCGITGVYQYVQMTPYYSFSLKLYVYMCLPV